MKRSYILAASIALASVATAQDKNEPGALMSPSATGSAGTQRNEVGATILDTNYNPTNGTTTMVVDLSGEQSWDGLGDGSNTVLLVPLGAGASMTGIGWDCSISTVGGSWLSEARLYFDGSDQDLSGLFLAPGIADGTAGTGSYSSGGILDLTDNGIPDIPVGGDGNLWIELYESFDDVPDAVDADWTAGGVTVEFEGGAAGVPTVSQWGLIIMTVMLLLGVVVMSLKSKRQAVTA